MTWVAVAIGGSAVVGAGTAIYEGKQAKKKSKSQNEIDNLLADNVKKTSPMGLDFLGDFNSDTGAAEDYWKTLALGDRTKQLDLLAPELSQEDQAQSDALGRDTLLSPRGSGSPERRLGLLDSAFARRNNALLSLRPTAFGNLAQLGGARGQLGASLLGASSSTGLGLGNLNLGRAGQSFDQERAGAAGLAQLLELLANYYHPSGGGSGGGGYAGAGATGSWSP